MLLFYSTVLAVIYIVILYWCFRGSFCLFSLFHFLLDWWVLSLHYFQNLVCGLLMLWNILLFIVYLDSVKTVFLIGYFFILFVDENENKSKSPKNRERNIIWFNPLFSKNVSNNIGKYFPLLIQKYFLNNHKNHKIFNKNNMNISYSCMADINQLSMYITKK